MIIKFDPFRVQKDEPIIHDNQLVVEEEGEEVILIVPEGSDPSQAPASGGAPS